MNIHEFLSRLHNVKQVKRGWMALCPAHHDRKPSLRVNLGSDGKILVKCFAGCTTEQICSSLGLELRDLFPNNGSNKGVTVEILARGKALPMGFLMERFGLTDTKFGNQDVVLIPYRDEQGNVVARRYRTAVSGKNRFKWEKGSKVFPYGLWLLNGNKDYVIVTEGESDTWTLAYHDFPVLGIPGKGTFKPEWSKYLSPFKRIYVWQEPDASDFPVRIQQALKRDVFVIDAQKAGAKDPSDLHVLCANYKKDFKAEFQRLLDTAELREWKPSEQPAEKKKAEKEGKESQAKLAFLLAKGEAEYFADNNNDIYAVIPINGHKELWPVRSKNFKRWLARRFFEQHDRIMNQEAIRQTVMLIESFCDTAKPKRLWLRVGKSENGKIYYDLVNSSWEAVEISANGWRIVDNPLVNRRTKNMREQVKPIPCDIAELNRLRKYIKTESFPLILAWLVACLIPDIPHPVLVLYGDKGSAKTTTMRMLRSLIDPAYQDSMIMPEDPKELALTLASNYMPTFDNLESLRNWQSNILCLGSTGGGVTKRELYTDVDEVIMSFNCATILTGINQVAVRDDLLDRSLLIKLNRISERDRLTIIELWQDFEQDKPYILGALFTLASKVLGIIQQIKLPYLFRMADFTLVGYAASQAFFGDGSVFLDSYAKNIDMAVEESVTADPVGYAIMEFAKQHISWSGSASDLLANLSDFAKYPGFPNHPSHFTRRINKIKSALKDLGISVVEERTRSKRIIHISLVDRGELASRAPRASQARFYALSHCDANLAGASHTSSAGRDPKCDVQTAICEAKTTGSVTYKPLKTLGCGAHDARDAQNPPLSGDHNQSNIVPANLAKTQPKDLFKLLAVGGWKKDDSNTLKELDQERQESDEYDPARKCIFCRFSSIIEENGEDKAVCNFGLDYASCDRFQLLE